MTVNPRTVAIFSIIAVLLSAAMAPAAPVHFWSGPGPRACMGRCSVEWAISQLSEERQDAVRAAMDAAPFGYSIPIRNGATFAMMSYYESKPRADMRPTVATLEREEPAQGWQFDGWSFVQIEGCQNWAVLIDTPGLPTAGLGGQQPSGPAYTASTGPEGLSIPASQILTSSLVPLFPLVTGGGVLSGQLSAGGVIPGVGAKPVIEITDTLSTPGPIVPATIPLPTTILLILSGLASLGTLRFFAATRR